MLPVSLPEIERQDHDSADDRRDEKSDRESDGPEIRAIHASFPGILVNPHCSKNREEDRDWPGEMDTEFEHVDLRDGRSVMHIRLCYESDFRIAYTIISRRFLPVR